MNLRPLHATAAVLLACMIQVAAADPTGKAAEIIKQLRMKKIPQEGAWFAGTYRSDEVLPANAIRRYNGAPHVAGSAIYGLVTREDFSALHKLETDEIWHYYGGDPLELLLLFPDGRGEVVILGPDILKGQQPQYAVPRGVWQGARPVNRSPDAYTLFGCTLAPGFEYQDFAMGYRDELQRAYPKYSTFIGELTRQAFVTRPAARQESAPVMAEPTVFRPEAIATIDVAPGISLHELIGRTARVRTDAYSVALFTLAPGQSMSTSYNKVSEEIFLIVAGQGQVMLDSTISKVTSGSIAVIKPQVRHNISASADSALSFYAISVPAFSPDDYVVSPDR